MHSLYAYLLNIATVFGVQSRIRTDDFAALQAGALDHSAICTINWREVGESNSQGAFNARRISSAVQSPV